MTAIDDAHKNFEKFLQDIKIYKNEDLSESDTRSKLLDQLLIGVLGWSEPLIEREGYVRVGFFDYELKTSTFRFVVEAKRAEQELKLPLIGNHAKLRSIYSSNKVVIDQIRGYLFERGLAYGVITNGTQFIIGNFVSITGADWKENDCRFYKNLEDVQRHFIDFYNLLSFSIVSTTGLIKITSEEFTSKTILRTENLANKDSELVRNQISNELIPVINKVFEEIYHLESLESRDVLEKCYVSNEDFKKYNSEIEHLFADTAPTFDTRITRLKNTKNIQESITSELMKDMSTLPAPIILIGTAGCGKTTFIKYFTEIVLENKVKNKRPIVYVDFRLFTSQIVHDTRFIYQRIIYNLEEQYPELELTKINILKTIYKRDIEKKKEGTWSHIKDNEYELNKAIAVHIETCQSEPLHHLQRISSYLIYQCGKRLCIIFDNADQLDDNDQKEVFLLGNSINRELKAVVLISLREGYFYKWKNQPPFNAYQSLIYHISAPAYKEVLRRRIDYVVSNFEFTPAVIQTQNKSVTFEQGSLKHLFKTLYETLFSKDNSDVLSFLQNTSYPNLRQGLETFKSFLLSGHSKISEYMSFDYGHGGIPIWEFVKSVALESKHYYDSTKSPLVNLFYPVRGNRNHFTKIRILLFLQEKTVDNKKVTFIAAGELINLFVSAGYNREIVLDEVQALFKHRLISTSDYSEDIEIEVLIEDSTEIAVTPIGLHYVRTLLNRFYYLDLVLQDTPIFTNRVYEELVKVFPESDSYGYRNLEYRIQAAQKFIGYLESEETQDHINTSAVVHINALNFQIAKAIKVGAEAEFHRLHNRQKSMDL